MSNDEKVKSSAAMMKEMSAYVKAITAVLPALSIVSLLAGKEFMEAQLADLGEKLDQIADAVSKEQSFELQACMKKKESFERALEKVRNANITDKLSGIITLVSV